MLLTYDEIRRMIEAVDRLEPDARAPMRHVIMPEVFGLLHGCGLRLNEVLKLRVACQPLRRMLSSMACQPCVVSLARLQSSRRNSRSRPWFIAATLLFLGLAFRRPYLQQQVCEPGAACA